MDDSNRAAIANLSFDMAYDLTRGTCFDDVATDAAFDMTVDVGREPVLLVCCDDMACADVACSLSW